MKILYVTHGGGSQNRGLPNGSARVVIDLASSHSRVFLPSIVFMGQEGGGSIEAKRLAQAKGIKHFDIEWRGHNNLRAIVAALFRLYQIIRSEKPDVVCLNAVPATYLAWLPARLAGTRLILAIIQLIPTDRKERFLAKFLRFSHHVVFVSPSLSNYYLQLGLGIPNRSVIQSGIELARFTNLQWKLFQRAPYCISMVARLHPPHKDPITLLNAFSIVRQRNYPVKLRFIGDGRARAQIETLASERGLQDRVEITGYTELVPEYLQDTDVFVLSTWCEGLPIAVIEAMALGLPVIASRVVGVTDTIDDRHTGLLVPPGNAEAMAQAIISLVENPGEALKLGHNARQYALEHFDRRRMTKQYEELILRLIQPAR
jgi:glycosyltransferase involved in cell wall biosynthesis